MRSLDRVQGNQDNVGLVGCSREHREDSREPQNQDEDAVHKRKGACIVAGSFLGAKSGAEDQKMIFAPTWAARAPP